MRDIKFRGKRVDNGEWVYGDLLQEPNQCINVYWIISKGTISFKSKEEDIIDFIKEAHNKVNKDTVGQYTGLKDKNGKEIYEGDIVKFKDVGEEGYEYKEGFDFDNIVQVVYENGIYTLSNFGESDNSYYATNCTDAERLEEVLRNGNCEVVGNIYDNPELLEEK